MNHYYTNEKIEHEEEYSFSYDYKGKKFLFLSRSGVFSKRRVDFGTHVLLSSLPEFSDEKIIDVGCGVGIIGIILAGTYKGVSVTGIDINKRAVELGNVNSKRNGCKNIVFIESDLYENVDSKFDVIITNPPIRAGKKIINKIVEEGYNKLNNSGRIYLVIQGKQGAPSMKKYMEDVFGNVDVVSKEKGYFVFLSKKQL